MAPLAGNLHDVNIYRCFDGLTLQKITPENEKHFLYLLTDELAGEKLKKKWRRDCSGIILSRTERRNCRHFFPMWM